MIQKDDRKYTFVVSYSNRNLIRVRRIELSKRFVNICASLVFLILGAASYGYYSGTQHNNTNITTLKSLIFSKGFLSTTVSAGSGEGGPETTESPLLQDAFEEKIRNLEKSFRDSEHKPSIYPLTGKINNEFGWRPNPFGGSSMENHPGMDIDGEKGDPVVASANGVVVKAGLNGGYGNLIELDHGNGMTTRYGHLSEIEVEVGEQVTRGQEIGKVGSTGRSTGPHLHYEVRIDGEAVNPRDYLPSDGL